MSEKSKNLKPEFYSLIAQNAAEKSCKNNKTNKLTKKKKCK